MPDIHGFELVREQALPELASTVRHYRHVKTGAQLASFINADDNKVFGASFKTPPSDSTGIAHILEHSVLCGSRKYPVKEPFIQLAKSSMATFLNAMTFSDKTIYPVASANMRDFYNLVDVYLDTVFHARLAPETFAAQGWHYELESPNAAMIYKGVVFNEMKGAYSTPEARISVLAQQSLFPDNAYGFDAGGDPTVVPELTYQQLKAFHERYYHPSNAQLFFWGDDDPTERLRLLDAYLAEFQPLVIEASVALQTRFASPRRVHKTYPSSQDDASARPSLAIVSWMLDEVTDSGSWLLYALLDEILVGTPASPLRKALIDSGLGEDIIGGGFDGDLRQAIFSIGLQGMETGTADKLETLVLNTLRGLADRGIDKATIDAALNTVEFRLRENNTGSEPRGIIVLIRALRSWTYDRDPLAPLEFAGTFTRLAERLAEGERVFEHLVRQHLIENPHRTLVGLDPDRTQAEREAATERTRLEMARAAMTPAEIQAVVDQTRALKTLQDTPDTPKALATIPALKPSDLPRQGKHLPIAEQMLEEARVFTHDLPTNGIVYLDVGLDVRQLPAELLPMAELFGRVLLETGAGRRDAVALTQLIGQQTGGLSSMTLTSSVRQSPSATSWLFLRGKATTARVGALVDILRDVLVEARLDNRHRIQQLILEEKATFEQHLIPSGSIYAMRRAAAGVHEAHWANEQIGGLTRLFALRNLAETIDQDWPAAQAMIERLRGILVNRRALVLNVTADGAGLARSMPAVQRLLAVLPSVPVARPAWPADTSSTRQGLTVPAQVNYVAKVANLGRLGHQITGATAVIRKYISDTWLWDKVRVQGGAYGGYMSLNADSGMLAMLSYRDPNLLGTLEVFDKAAAFLRHLDLSQSELDRIIVGTIGDIDAYLLPDAKGFQSMEERLTGWTGETKQVYREEIFATRKADFRAFADVLDRFTKEARIAVLGSETAIAAANAERAGMFAVTKVM